MASRWTVLHPPGEARRGRGAAGRPPNMDRGGPPVGDGAQGKPGPTPVPGGRRGRASGQKRPGGPAQKSRSATTPGGPYRTPTPVGWGTSPKVDERSLVKELGKLAPSLREKGRPASVSRASPEEREGAAGSGLKRLFTKNTGLCHGASRRIGADAGPVPEGQGEGCT